MQIFQKQKAILAGITPVIEILRECSGYFENDTWINKSREIKIETLGDGEIIEPWETVMHIKGPYAYFAHLESVYLGILARCSKIATNAKNVVTAAKNKQVIFFADRFDYFANQELDGYAAHVGGIDAFATRAQSLFINRKSVGTIPHALIAIHNGNTIKAAGAFVKNFPDIPLIVLVDFDNDCVKTALEVARHFGKKLYGVRLDTSETMIDKSLQDEGVTRVEGLLAARTPLAEGAGGAPTGGKPGTGPRGVNPILVNNVREALDKEGFQHVKIVASGGFDFEKIKLFEQEEVPVDIYGVGSSLLKENIDFTADIVQVENKQIAKVGRHFTSSKKLQAIDMM